NVSAPAREAVCVVAVGFEVVAPGFSPEGSGNLASVQHHRRGCVAALLRKFCQRARGFGPPLAHRYIRPPSVRSPAHIFISDISKMLIRRPWRLYPAPQTVAIQNCSFP